MLAAALREGLTALGRDVIDADVAATPTTGVLVRQHGAAGGVQISASHNPPQYNGLKLFSADGRVMPEAIGGKIMHRYRAAGSEVETGGGSTQPIARGRVLDCADTTSEHLSLIERTVDVDRIRQRGSRSCSMPITARAACWAARCWNELGCRVTILGETPDGQFEHDPNRRPKTWPACWRPYPATVATSDSARIPMPIAWP